MPDREKVIKWLDVCKTADRAVGLKEDYPCRECPYKGSPRCMRELVADALELLKEQVAVEPEFVRNGWRCGVCGHVVLTYCFDINEGEMGKEMANYCPSCGRAVKWE